MFEMYLADPQLICFGVLDSFSIQQIADANEVDDRIVKEWIASGELKAYLVSSTTKSQKPVYRVHEDDWLKFMEVRSSRQSNPAPRRQRRKLPKVRDWTG